MLCWKDSQNYNQSGEVTQAEVKPVKKKLKLKLLRSYGEKPC